MSGEASRGIAMLVLAAAMFGLGWNLHSPDRKSHAATLLALNHACDKHGGIDGDNSFDDPSITKHGKFTEVRCYDQKAVFLP